MAKKERRKIRIYFYNGSDIMAHFGFNKEEYEQAVKEAEEALKRPLTEEEKEEIKKVIE